MRHRHSGRKLGKTATHRKAMLANMVTALFKRERIETTIPKAKEARMLAERLITAAKRGNAAAEGGVMEKQLAARRNVARTVRDSEVLRKLFGEIAPRYVERPGGYTRIIRLGKTRVGDAAEMAILELLKKDEEGRKKKKKPRKTYRKLDMPGHGPAKKAAKAAEPEVAAEAPAEAPAAAEPEHKAPKAEAHHKAPKKEKTKEAAPKPKKGKK